jgi:hypothetical protein
MGNSQKVIGNNRSTRDVAIQDQTTEIIDLHLSRLIDAADLREALAIDATSAKITTGTLPTVGDTLCLKDVDGVAFYQGGIIGVTIIGGGDYDVDLDSPLDFPFSTDDGCSIRSEDLAVDGSITPITFIVSPFGLADGTEWDIVRCFGSINGTSAMDDGLFGDLPALTKGIVIRTDDGVTKNIFNAKTNGDFELHTGDRKYAEKAPAGQTSVSFRRTFGGQNKNGVVARLRTSDGDGFKCIVQDDLSGLVSFSMVAQGHIVQP